MAQHWETTLQTRLSRAVFRRGWMLWAIWGMLGGALTLEGTVDLTGLTVSAVLSAPFWLAFALWPFFCLWRLCHDRRLLVREVQSLVHAPDGQEAVALPVLVCTDTLRVPAEEVRAALGSAAASLLAGVPAEAPRPEAGVPFETYTAEALGVWSLTYLEKHGQENDDPAAFARWADTCRRSAQAVQQ